MKVLVKNTSLEFTINLTKNYGPQFELRDHKDGATWLSVSLDEIGNYLNLDFHKVLVDMYQENEKSFDKLKGSI